MVNSDETEAKNKTHVGGTNSDPDLPPVYQLNNSDGPGNMLVGEVLTSANYGEWALDMKDALLAKNKFGFVDGTLIKPTDLAEKNAWIQCDAMVKGWLKTSMDKEIRSSIRFAETALEIWSDLRDRFGQGSSSRAYELRQLISLLQQEKRSVSSFYTKLRSYWEEASAIAPLPSCYCGHCTCDVSKQIREYQEHSRLIDFLMGLDEGAFGAVRTQVLAMKPTPNLPEAFNIVLNTEQQKLISQNRKASPEAAAFAAHGENNRQARGTGEQRERVRCTHCQKTGHLREACWELIGYPPRDRQNERHDGGDRQDRQGDEPRRRPREPSHGTRVEQQGREPRASKAEAAESPVPGFTIAQLNQLKHFFGLQDKGADEHDPAAHMPGLTIQEIDWEG